MSGVFRFTRWFISAVIVLMMVMLGAKPYTVSAQENEKTERSTTVIPSQDQPTAPKAAPLGTNLIKDPGFEASYGSNQYWTQALGDTICIWWGAGCSVTGAGYHSGGSWACFGCLGSNFDDIYQDVAFPKCGAQLEFYLYIGESLPGGGWGADNYFTVSIDATEVFRAYGFQVSSYQPYTKVTIPLNDFANGAVRRVRFHSENLDNFLWFNLDDVALYQTLPLSAGCATIAVKTNTISQGTYGVPPNSGERLSFPVNNGPVFVTSTNGKNIIAAERVNSKDGAKITHFSELMGLPQNLVSTTYAFPAYDNLFFDSQLRFGNVSNTTATVRLYIGTKEMTSGCNLNSPYGLAPSASLRVSCPGVSDGPVRLVSTVPIVAAMRVLYNNGRAVTSFSELMGLPASQWNTTYWMPWYNNVDLNTQLRIGNVSNTTATVRLYIAGVEKTSGCTVNSPYTLGANKSLRVSCPGVNSGPVRIVSTGPIVASQRVAHFNGIKWNDFSELMGLPASQLTATYLFPWYNNKDLDTQLRFGNVSTSTAHVYVFIGGAAMPGSPFTVLPGASLRKSFAGINNGPVKIVSDVNIVASMRVLINNGSAGLAFSELMGLPQGLLTTSYVFPWYNNTELDTQLRFGVP